MVSRRLDSISLELFDCLDDRDNEDCGVFRNETKTDPITGEITCLLCSLIVGTEEEDPEAAAGGADEDDEHGGDQDGDGCCDHAELGLLWR